jgi:propanediol dehydratase large subunit
MSRKRGHRRKRSQSNQARIVDVVGRLNAIKLVKALSKISQTEAPGTREAIHTIS